MCIDNRYTNNTKQHQTKVTTNKLYKVMAVRNLLCGSETWVKNNKTTSVQLKQRKMGLLTCARRCTRLYKIKNEETRRGLSSYLVNGRNAGAYSPNRMDSGSIGQWKHITQVRTLKRWGETTRRRGRGEEEKKGEQERQRRRERTGGRGEEEAEEEW